jgi:YjjG family noncanonical pyrimidine nucleotidase
VRYSTLLLDLDHTLLDSNASEVAAFEQTLRWVGVDEPMCLFDAYTEINRALWAQVEAGTITPVDVRIARFEQFLARTDLDADPEAVADAFVLALGANGDLYPGARDVLDELAAAAELALVTNGISEVQRARIERLRLEQYFDAIVISSEVGVSKPATEIFESTFAQLGAPNKASALMVGDSLTSDIQGGANYGIATCWYNPHGKSAADRADIGHEIARLAQLPGLAATGRVG